MSIASDLTIFCTRMVDLMDHMDAHQLASVQKTQHLRELSQDGTSHWLLLVGLLGSDAQ